MYGSRLEGEGNVAEHHHQVVVNHGAQTLSLANPLLHLAVEFLVAGSICVILAIGILDIQHGAFLSRSDELVAILDKVVGSRPEIVDVTTLFVAIET